MIMKETIQKSIEDLGYPVASLKCIPEGANHLVYKVTLKDGEDLICKIPTQREGQAHQAPHLDTLFEGPLSLKREANLYKLALKEGGVPAPKVYNLHESSEPSYILLECMPGIPFQTTCVADTIANLILLNL